MLEPQRIALRLSIAAISAVFVLVPTEAWTAPRYSITSLGPVGGPGAFNWSLSAINNDGWVTANAKLEGTDTHRGFLWKPNTGWSDLGTLGGDWSSASDMNDHGWIVGASTTATGENHTCLWYSEGNVYDLGVFGGISSTARGINNRGDVVGEYNVDVDNTRPFRWNFASGMSDLGLPPDFQPAWQWDKVSAEAVSDRGHIALSKKSKMAFGWFNNNAYLKDAEGWVRVLGRPPGSGSTPFVEDVNNWGQVVGHWADRDDSGAYLWQRESWTAIGDFGGGESQAWAINNRGQVVGMARNAEDRARAYVWERGDILDLNDCIPSGSGWELYKAQDINDQGQILTYGKDPNGNYNACVLTPDVEPRQPGFYAVLVGVGDDGLLGLFGDRGDKDAQAIYDVLCEYPGVNPGDMKLILNPDLSDPDQFTIVQDAVRDTVSGLQPGDRFMFYYAGHSGTPTVGNSTAEPAVPYSQAAMEKMGTGDEWNIGDEVLYVVGGLTSVNDDDLTNLLSDQQNPHLPLVSKTIIIDSCFSGGFWGNEGNGSDEGDLDKLSNVGLLAACGEGEIALTNFVTGRGKFSSALESVLRLNDEGTAEADLNGDGKVTFQELEEALSQAYTVDNLGGEGFIRGLPWLDEPVEASLNSLAITAAASQDFDVQDSMIPEPATLYLLSVGVVFFLTRRR